MPGARHLAFWLAVLFACALSPAPYAAEIVLAHPGSPYGDAILAVTKVIIEDRLGIPVRIVHASAPVAFKAMDANRGAIDVLGSMQLPTSQSQVDEYVTRRGTVVVAQKYWQFRQGACTTKATADKYAIATIYDLTRPEIVELTARAGDAKGEFWVGAADWNAAAIDKVRARFYGLDQLYTLTTSQADLEYARVGNAIKAGAPIFWACDTASNFIFPRGAVAMLTEPPHDPAKWHPVLPSQDPDWFEKSRIETAWPPVRVAYAYAKHLQTDFPECAHLLEGIELTADMVGGWTYATFTEKQDLDEYAKSWVKANAATVDRWLAP
jgi:glycine betaine/proline transport system substrate-binding protein